MDERRIAELLAPFLTDRVGGGGERPPQDRDAAVLSSHQLRSILMYIDILLRWNNRISLTAVREPDEIVTRHFGESLFTALRLFPEPVRASKQMPHLIDVGSGAGFPGLPIKIWSPHTRVTLIESNQKKAIFLREVVRSLKLGGVDIFANRAETFPKSTGDAVTLRAVERFESVLPVAAGLVGSSGCLAILAGGSQKYRIRELLPAMKWDEPARLPLSSNRVLIMGRKESEM